MPDQPGRDQADRGRARPGLGRLGRQRPHRRRQHHHQDPARAAGRRASRCTGGTLRPRRAARASRTGRGTSFGGSFSYAKAPNDRWSYRLPRGYFNSDPYSRPTGTVPLDCHPLGASPCRIATVARARRLSDRRRGLSRRRGPAGRLREHGTSQPKVDLRLDQELHERRPHDLQRRLRGHRGHRPHRHRPLRHAERLVLGYGRVGYTKGALKIAAFAQLPRRRGAEPAPRRTRTRGSPISLNFKTQTYDLEVGNSNVLGGQAHPHLRRQRPAQQLRHHARAQRRGPQRVRRLLPGRDLLRQVPLRARRARRQVRQHRGPGVLAARHASCSSRAPDHSFRVSYNQAFRSPSAINNFLDQDIQFPTPVNLTPLRPLLPPPLQPLVPPPFLLTVNAFGNPDDGGVVHGRLRGRLHGHVRRQDHRRAGRSTATTPTTTSTSPTSSPRGRRATRRRRTTASRTRRRASRSRRPRRPRSRSRCRRS